MRAITQLTRRAKRRLPVVPEPILRVAVTLKEVIVETFRGFNADRGIDLAGSLAFTTLLTAVPLLATFSLFIAAFFQEKDTQILDVINQILPYHTARITQNLRDFVSESMAISTIGLIFLIVSSLRLIFIIEATFNAVWGAPKRRAWFSRMAIYTFVLIVLALLMGAIASGVGGLGGFAKIPTFPFLVEFAALTLLYRFLPNAHVHWTSAAIAGAAMAGLLELLRTIFGRYVETLSRMNLITGSLTLLMLTLVSVFFVWVLILLGVELTHVLQTKLRRRKRGIGAAGRAGRAENAIRMLLRLATGGAHKFRDLYKDQEASSVEAEKILDCLKENGLVQGSNAQGYELAVPAGDITVARVVEAISPNLYAITPDEADKVCKVLQPLFDRMDAERRALLGATIADLR
ncbi:MAG: YhjD/YihY/BrkB family envelope integrity protein [Thermoanaerobaculia bacterium]